MAKKKYVLISLVTRQKLIKEPYGRRILSIFYDEYPLLSPQFANYYEPVNNPINSVDEALEYWGKAPFLCRRKKSIVGSWYVSEDNNNIGWLTFEYNWNPKINWYQLFKELVVITDTYFGYIHVFSDNEVEPAGVGSAIGSFLWGTPSIHLKKGIPQLGWANYFGEEYVKEIDVSLLQKNGFDVEELGEGYLFHVTDKLSDVIDNYAHFDERRKHLKSLFRPDLFQKYERYG